MLLVIGMAIVDIPHYSVDENNRHAALTLIPDQVRARVSLILDLGRQSLGFIVAGLLGLIGSALGMLWITGLISMVFGAAALIWALVLMRRWEHSMLSWRLRRRKKGAFDVLSWADDE